MGQINRVSFPAMSNKTALITGGSSGIGLELAKCFAAHGHDLILVARNIDALEAEAGKIEGKYGVKASTLAFDLADPDSPQKLFDAITAENIQVDFLVNNAGFGLGGEFVETDLSTELDMIQVNVTTVVHLTKLFLPAMVKRKEGRVMNVASTAAFQPGPLASIYYSTKAFVLSFSEAIAEELRNSGVTVTALCPGPTHTNFAERSGTAKSRLFTQSAVATAEEVARYGYAAMMHGQRVTIPGMGNKFLMQLERVSPRRFTTFVTRKIQESR
jgi:short-subunit dehydrogenase